MGWLDFDWISSLNPRSNFLKKVVRERRFLSFCLIQASSGVWFLDLAREPERFRRASWPQSNFVASIGVENLGFGEMKHSDQVRPPTTSQGDNDLEAHMLQNSDEPPVADGAPLLENRPLTPPTDSLLYVCMVLSIVSALGSVLCMVVNLVSLLRSFDSRGFDYRVSVRFPLPALCLFEFRVIVEPF